MCSQGIVVNNILLIAIPSAMRLINMVLYRYPYWFLTKFSEETSTLDRFLASTAATQLLTIWNLKQNRFWVQWLSQLHTDNVNKILNWLEIESISNGTIQKDLLSPVSFFKHHTLWPDYGPCNLTDLKHGFSYLWERTQAFQN